MNTNSDTDLLTTYHATLLEAQRVEALHPEGSEEEESLLSILDDLWYAMTEEERLEANALCREVGYTDEE